MGELKYIEYDEESRQTIYRFNGVNPLDMKVFDKVDSVKELKQKLERLESENEKLRECVEMFTEFVGVNMAKFNFKTIEKARKTLKEIKGSDEA